MRAQKSRSSKARGGGTFQETFPKSAWCPWGQGARGWLSLSPLQPGWTVCLSSCQGDVRESAGPFLGRTLLPDERRLGMRRAPLFSLLPFSPQCCLQKLRRVLPKRLVTLHSLKVPLRGTCAELGLQAPWNQPLADFCYLGKTIQSTWA